jgi:hypothetical protein
VTYQAELAKEERAIIELSKGSFYYPEQQLMQRQCMAASQSKQMTNYSFKLNHARTVF